MCIKANNHCIRPCLWNQRQEERGTNTPLINSHGICGLMDWQALKSLYQFILLNWVWKVLCLFVFYHLSSVQSEWYYTSSQKTHINMHVKWQSHLLPSVCFNMLPTHFSILLAWVSTVLACFNMFLA